MKYILMGLMLLLSSGCSTVTHDNLVHSSKKGVNIALMVPMSGASSALGNSIAQAAKMATQDASEIQVNLEVIDTGSNQEIDQAALSMVKAGKFSAVIGPLFAAHTKAVEQVMLKSTPVISFSNDESLAGKTNLYLAGFLPQQQIERVTQYSAAHGYKNIYALLPRNRYGEAVARALEGGFKEGVYDLKLIAYYEDAQTMRLSAQQIIDATMPKVLELAEMTDELHEKSAVLIPEGGARLAEIMHYIHQNKGDDAVDVKFLGASGWREQDIAALPGLGRAWVAAPPQASLDEFKKRYKSTFNQEPFDLAVLGYDITKLVMTLLQYPGDINAELKRPEGFTGFAGTFKFTESGSNKRNLGISEVREQKFVEVSPSEEQF